MGRRVSFSQSLSRRRTLRAEKGRKVESVLRRKTTREGFIFARAIFDLIYQRKEKRKIDSNGIYIKKERKGKKKKEKIERILSSFFSFFSLQFDNFFVYTCRSNKNKKYQKRLQMFMSLFRFDRFCVSLFIYLFAFLNAVTKRWKQKRRVLKEGRVREKRKTEKEAMRGPQGVFL